VIFSASVHSRIEAHTVETASSCLEVRGYRPDHHGHIRIRVGSGRMEYVHRIAKMEELGRPLVTGEIVRHVCNNPPCRNPQHLLLGTVLDNAQDRKQSGRYEGKRGKRGPNLTRIEVAEIKMKLRLGQGLHALARQYSVVPETIRRIKVGLTFREVLPAPREFFEFDPFADDHRALVVI